METQLIDTLIKSIFLFLLSLSASFPTNISFAEDELLSSEEAFKFSATLVSPKVIQAVWEIADGYYLYKDKLSFDYSGRGTLVAEPNFPDGEIKQDDLFGEVEVFTETLTVKLPISSSDPQSFILTAKGQGCNEPVGICYPPMTRKAVLTALGDSTLLSSNDPVSSNFDNDTLDTSSQVLSNLDSANDLRALLSTGFDQRDFLDVDEAFTLEVEANDKNSVTAHFLITNGYYLYRDKISVAVNGENINVLIPSGKIKQDEYFGEVEIFDSDFNFPVELDNTNDKNNLIFSYQGCAEDGVCYSPVSKTLPLESLLAGIGDDNISTSNNVIEAKIPTADNPNQTDGQPDGNQKSLLGLLLGAFIAGIFLTFTPCVLPLIPILFSVIAGQGTELTRTKAVLLSTSYVAGTMLTYALMGALAGATGEHLQAYFQNIWAIGILSGLFLLMALSMFGLFELQMPGSIQERIQTKTGNLGGSVPLVFILGLLSALIVGACVSPILISFLSVAITGKSPVLGAQIMAAMALGIGLPLIIIGVGAGHIIPRVGQWMEKIKQGFGIMLVAVAIYLLGQLPEIPILLVWGSFFIILSIFLGATQHSLKPLTAWHRFKKGVGIILLVWGIFMLIGSFFGQRDILKPIPQGLITQNLNSSGRVSPEKTHPFIYVKNIEQLNSQLTSAQAATKMVMIDYYADWCVDCVRMEKTTFANPHIKTLLEQKFVTLKIDVTDPNDENGKALKKHFNVFGPPATLFINIQGQLITEKNFYGYKNSDDFLALISDI